MSDGTLETINGRPALRFERALPHRVERVWQAVSDPTELALWFPAAAPWTPKAGESVDAGGVTVEVTEVDVPRRLAWTCLGDDYSFDLTPTDDGCVLVFTHVFDDRDAAAQTAAGWDTYLVRLNAHLDGEFIEEFAAHENWSQRHERYAERWGIDPAPGRKFWSGITNH